MPTIFSQHWLRQWLGAVRQHVIIWASVDPDLCRHMASRGRCDELICIIWHYSDVIMSTMASQITSLTIVYSSVYSGTDQRKHQSSASLAFVREIHRWLVNSPHKGPVTRKMFPFDDVIMDKDYICLIFPHRVTETIMSVSHVLN